MKKSLLFGSVLVGLLVVAVFSVSTAPPLVAGPDCVVEWEDCAWTAEINYDSCVAAGSLPIGNSCQTNFDLAIAACDAQYQQCQFGGSGSGGSGGPGGPGGPVG